jgi:hypothetical protein
MEKFLLLVREDLNMLQQIGQEEHYKGIHQMMKWVESLTSSGNYTGGEPLLTTGKYVSRDSVLTDGPFIEAKESVSGYIFLQAENLEQAAAIARTCPLVMEDKLVIEVRPIMTIDPTLLGE